MRIREVWIRNFRNFKADRGPIRFVDEETGEVRPLTVLVGANGSGKTTIFEVIEDLLWSSLFVGLDIGVGLVPARLEGLLKKGFVAIEVAFGAETFELVEGETPQDDPFFYTQWFGNLTSLSFFAQNGWQQVERAVKELRARFTGRPVYGIIDRDLSPSTVIDAQFREEPADGIFRTERYTLENYLFEPSCWHRVIRALHRGAPPEGWSNESEIAQRIEECYREFLPVAAYNWVIRRENERNPDHNGRKDRTHTQQIRADDPSEFAAWGRTRGCDGDLGQAYLDRLAFLQGLPLAQGHCWIHGKYLLENVWLPRVPKRATIDNKHLVSLYIDQCATPPEELERLIRRILQVTQR